MTLGTPALKKFGEILEKRGASPEIAASRIPDQGFYNVGQKLFAVPSVLGGIVIAVSGIIMALSNVYFTNTAIGR